MRYLLARARWDTGGLRDDLRGYVTAGLGGGDYHQENDAPHQRLAAPVGR